MRAAVFRGVGLPFAIEERPDPLPGPHQAVLKVHRCGICGTDLHLTSGHGPAHPSNNVLGHEYSGEVVDVGAGVRDLRLGDRVTALPVIGCGQCLACLAEDPMRCTGGKISASHGFAQYVLIGARSAVKLPAMVALADAALTEPLSCALRSVDKSNLRPGSRVLVIGAGPIGLAAAYWARRLGAGPVVVSARSTRAEHLAANMGASRFLVSTEDLAQEAAEALGGAPDLVMECSGAEGMIARSIDCVKSGGMVSVVGYCTTPDRFIPSAAILKEVIMVFSFVYRRQDFEHALAVMNSGDVVARSMITDTVSLDEFPAALEALRSPTDQCKVLLAPWQV